MRNDLRLPLLVSLAVHLTFITFTSIRFHRTVYINIPIELMIYNPPAAAPAAVPEKKTEEVAIPKKTKPLPAKKKAVIKETGKDAKPAPVPEPPRPLQPSNQLTLDTVRFPFAYYTNTIVRKIGRNWQWSSEFGRLKAVVYFRIQRNGELGKLEIRSGSGDKLFDQQAIRAVSLASPFPPLPEGYEEDALGVFFEFAFKQ